MKERESVCAAMHFNIFFLLFFLLKTLVEIILRLEGEGDSSQL